MHKKAENNSLDKILKTTKMKTTTITVSKKSSTSKLTLSMKIPNPYVQLPVNSSLKNKVSAMS